MTNNITTLKDNECTGCGACMNICPVGAITMCENSEGFLYPQVDEEKCTNCGLCKKTCPVIKPNYKNSKSPECYAYMANDKERLKSSSGGAFPVLAHWFINNGGYVAGAVWTKDCQVKHIVSNKPDDIEKMRNSKYLQSDTKDCYKDIKQLLEDDKKVLFTGTPCQVAGLKSFLGKDYRKLYCVDIICHGVPSPKVFMKYIREFLKTDDEKWISTNFRDKVNGWRPELTTTTTTTTTTHAAQKDNFMRVFLKNLCLRKTCTNCKFQTIPRQGDITIGDFWGIWNYKKSLDDKKGTSVILENNQRGRTLTKILKNNSIVYKKVPLKCATDGNPCLITSVKENKDRKLFFELLDNKNLKEITDICLNDRAVYLIVNFWDSYFNYGALYTAYALQSVLKSFGYISKNIDFGIRTNAYWYKDSYMEDFAKKYLNTTNIYNYKDLLKLSKDVKGVILGSDQVLRLEYLINDKSVCRYLLNWVDKSTRKIALSASFGINKEEFRSYNGFTPRVSRYMKNALSSFDYLSCREISSKEIYKDVFGLDSDQILDPVFLIDKNNYEEILKNSNTNNKDKIISYVLDDNDEYDKLYDYLSEKEQTEVVKIDKIINPAEDWLKNIKDCRLFVTDSFHGVCFALIFNKPFICIKNSDRGNARFDTLINLFGIGNNFVNSIDEIYKDDFNYSVDYEKVNNILKTKKENDLKIIEKVLKENYSNNPKAKENKITNEKYLNGLDFKNILKFIPLKYNYYRCKIFANFSSGSRKQHYVNKKNGLKQRIRNWRFMW